MTLSPFTVILLFWALAIAIVDDSMWIASLVFAAASINQFLMIWAVRPEPEEEERVHVGV